ncbi:toprim domain-containing protein [Pedobacter sp.]|uniref:toprim domain-containing protein n=1 Tax=Pedobacter sp. TaxID=1411316 RepID=UPI00396C7366
MDLQNNRVTIAQAKEIDMVQYLAAQGHEPTKIRGNDHWYLSPLRDEKSASFKVNAKHNIWYDHGMGKGGNLIDFGTLYFNCSVSDFLKTLAGSLSFQPLPKSNRKVMPDAPKIIIEKVGELTSPALLKYLRERGIDTDMATLFCKQVAYSFDDKKYYGIGFKNNSGGWEIRNRFYKTSSTPKDFTIIKNGSENITVFEGYMDFLSFIGNNWDSHLQSDYLVLNSLSFFDRALPGMKGYATKHLYLDNDDSGRKATVQALAIDKTFVDNSNLYKGFKDYNDWHLRRENPTLQSKPKPPKHRRSP